MVQSAPGVVTGSELAWLTYTQLTRKAQMLAAKQVIGCWSEFSIEKISRCCRTGKHSTTFPSKLFLICISAIMWSSDDSDSDYDFGGTWNDSTGTWNDYNVTWGQLGSDYDDYDYGEPFSLDFLPFRNLCEAATGYLDTQKEYPLYDTTMIEFIAIAEAATSATAWVYELKFHRFFDLPPELRLNVYTHLLKAAHSYQELARHLHVDRFNNPCCTWRWPNELIICDRNSGNELPTAKYAPWLPDLAFTNKQVLGEVTICMLSTTKWFDFKYEEHKPFNIVRWFTDFLSTFPTVMVNGVATTEAFAAIECICFPHESKYNEHRIGRVVDEKKKLRGPHNREIWKISWTSSISSRCLNTTA
ncbi:hypothetical protein IG631_09655 [Alternaria alternata]|nr:hypothetical protein IG631_09655 [Alternaria alternata]